MLLNTTVFVDDLAFVPFVVSERRPELRVSASASGAVAAGSSWTFFWKGEEGLNICGFPLEVGASTA